MSKVYFQKQEVVKQFKITMSALCAQRGVWHQLLVTAEKEGDEKLALVAKRNRDLLHSQIMDFGSRADILAKQFNK